MVNRSLLIFVFIIIVIGGCKQNIQPAALYGKWKYVKLDHPKSDDPGDTLSVAELNAADPSITFTAKNELSISWGGQIISHGSFTTSVNNIEYTEQLPNGTARTFPFYVSKLDSRTIVFETVDKKDAARVTAIKIN